MVELHMLQICKYYLKYYIYITYHLLINLGFEAFFATSVVQPICNDRQPMNHLIILFR